MPGSNTRPSPGFRPSLGWATKPTFQRPPGLADGGNQGGGFNRPGGGNRPDGPGLGNRPGRPDVGNRPGRPGTGNRPDRPGIGGRPDRPGRPDWAADRPGRPGRPDWNGNRPGRPGIGGNRPGIGPGGIWNSGTINSGNTTWWNSNTVNQVNNQISNSVTNVGVAAGNWGYGRPGYGRPGYGRPGYGYGRPGYDRWGYDRWGVGGWGSPGWNNHTVWANAWNTGYVNPRYGSWYNGCWSGDWGAGSWWTPFALGAATWGVASTVANWGLGSNWFGSSTGGYVNPYYVSAPAAVVEASPYNYAEPVIVSAVPDEADSQANPADRLVEAAIRDMQAGTYATALQSLDRAVKESPGDSVIHELRAVALFALGRYTEAAAALNAVLATAPGMDWTTLSSLYTDVGRYTGQLRRLEDFCRSHGDDAAAHFVLAYHYLVAGHPEQAADMLEVVVARHARRRRCPPPPRVDSAA